MRRFTVTAACWLVFVTLAEAQVQVHPTEHFAIYYRDDDLAPNRLTDAHVVRWGNWLEEAYTGFEGMKFKAPVGNLKKVQGKDRFVVGIHSFARSAQFRDHEGNPALRDSRGNIRINLDAFLTRSAEANKCTLAHELFHSIQHAYDENEESWIMEATARWAPWAIYPNIDQSLYAIGAEVSFINYSALPLSYVFSMAHAERGTFQKRYGRPYGASLFFRFLSKRSGGHQTMERVWSQCAATPGPNGLDAIGKALGGAPAFRAVYDEFALACTLGEHAPQKAQLADLDKLVGPSGKVSAPRIDLSPGWFQHCQTNVKATTFSPYLPTFRNAPDLQEFARTGTIPSPGEGIKGWVGGRGGIRCFSVAKPPNIEKKTSLEVAVLANPDEISLQGVTGSDGNNLKIHKASYDAKLRQFVLTIPDFDKTTVPVLLVLTRYADAGDAKNYALALTLKKQDASGTVTIAWAPVEYLRNPFNRIEVTTSLERPTVKNSAGYRLVHYWSQSASGPFVPCGQPWERLLNVGDHVDIIVDDRTAFNPGKPAERFPHLPLHYQAGVQYLDMDLKTLKPLAEVGPEIRSNILSPSQNYLIRVKDLPDDEERLKPRLLEVCVTLKEQQHLLWGTHLIVEAGGFKGHYWTPRQKDKQVFGALGPGRLSYARLDFPFELRAGLDTIKVTAELGSTRVERTLKLPPSPPDTTRAADVNRLQETMQKDLQQAAGIVKATAESYAKAEAAAKARTKSKDAKVEMLLAFTSERALLRDATELKYRTATSEAYVEADGLRKIAERKKDGKEAIAMELKWIDIQRKVLAISLEGIDAEEKLLRGVSSLYSDPKNFQSELDSLESRRKSLRSNHGQSIYFRYSNIQSLAYSYGEGQRLKEAMAEILKYHVETKQVPDAGFFQGSASSIARFTGARELAAELYRQGLQRQIDQANPADRDRVRQEIMSNLDRHGRLLPFWPENVPLEPKAVSLPGLISMLAGS